jgi:CrcB protein
MLNKVALVFLGGGIGSVLRYLLNYSFNFLQMNQVSTMGVNILGSFIFGIVYVSVAQNTILSIFLLTGILGGFTTFSQFTFDLIELNSQSPFLSLIYLFGTVIISILAGLFGVYIATKMVN